MLWADPAKPKKRPWLQSSAVCHFGGFVTILIILKPGCLEDEKGIRKEKYLDPEKNEISKVLGNVKVYDNYDKLIYDEDIEVFLEK